MGRVVFAIAVALVAGGTFAPAGAQSPDAPTDVCKLLTVKRPRSHSVSQSGKGRLRPGSQGTQDTCTWETQQADTGILGGTRLQLVASVQSNCAPDAKSCFKADKQIAKGKHEELDLKKIGGNEAFYEFAGEVNVLVALRILNVHFNNFNTNMFGRREFIPRTVDAAQRAEKWL